MHLASNTLCHVFKRIAAQRTMHTSGTKHTGALFNIDTEVRPSSSPNEFSGFVTNNWNIGDAPNGGYLMAMAIAAGRQTIPFRDPFSLTAYYTNKALPGEPVNIKVDNLNTTKGTATVAISLSQQGLLRSHYVGTFGTLSKLKGLNFSNTGPAPELPPPEKCFNSSKALRKHFGNHLPVAHRVEFCSPADDPFVTSALAGKHGSSPEASLTCWVRFADDKEPCLRSMAFLLDALPPPILGVTTSHWVPTLEYTVHFWQRADLSRRASWVPAGASPQTHPYWLRCKYNTPFALNGMLYTDAELWSEDGSQLLATARQLARVLTPR